MYFILSVTKYTLCKLWNENIFEISFFVFSNRWNKKVVLCGLDQFTFIPYWKTLHSFNLLYSNYFNFNNYFNNNFNYFNNNYFKFFSNRNITS